MSSRKGADIEFCKMSAAGNDFVLVDVLDSSKAMRVEKVLDDTTRVDFVKRVTHRFFGVGSDGVVFLRSPKKKSYDFMFDFYNSDGSVAEMCGNAARCVGRYFIEKYKKDVAHFETLSGFVSARRLDGDKIEVALPVFAAVRPQDKQLNLGSQIVHGVFFDSGVPHFVIPLDSPLSSADMTTIGTAVRNHVDLKPRGANATFYYPISRDEIAAVTFERGVEALTLACGTGAVAAARTFLADANRDSVNVQMPGGKLTVRFEDGFKRGFLAGAARYVCHGTLDSEVYL